MPWNKFAGNSGTVSGGKTNIIIAGFDAPQSVKDSADYVCDGIDDEVQFNEAIESQTAPGKIPIEFIGNFSVATPILITKDTKFIMNGVQTSDAAEGRGNRIKAKIGFIGNAVIQWNPILGLTSELQMQGVSIDVMDMMELMELGQEEMMEFMTTGNIPLAIWSQVGRVVLRECEIIGNIDSFGLRDLYSDSHIEAMNMLHPEQSALTIRGILPTISNCYISNQEGSGNSVTIAEGCVEPMIFSSIINNGMDDPFDLGIYKGNMGVPDTVEDGGSEAGASTDYWKELANYTFEDNSEEPPTASTVLFNGMDSAFENNPLPDLDKFKIDIMGEANVHLNTMTVFRVMLNDDGEGNYNNGDYYGFVNGGDSDNPFTINMGQGPLWYATIGQVEAASIAVAKIELIFEKQWATDEYYWVQIRIQGFNPTTGNKVDYEGFCVCKEPSEAPYINMIGLQAFNGTFHGTAKLSMWSEGTTQR